jgi:hypothetical protein
MEEVATARRKHDNNNIREMFLGHFSLEENSQNRNDFVIKLEILD